MTHLTRWEKKHWSSELIDLIIYTDDYSAEASLSVRLDLQNWSILERQVNNWFDSQNWWVLWEGKLQLIHLMREVTHKSMPLVNTLGIDVFSFSFWKRRSSYGWCLTMHPFLKGAEPFVYNNIYNARWNKWPAKKGKAAFPRSPVRIRQEPAKYTCKSTKRDNRKKSCYLMSISI
jgi:hypothetical protein